MTLYAVGDIQGCLSPLECLLKEVNFDPARDQLWFCGDLVNRGPRSLDTLRFARSLGDAATVVLGNHDLHLLAVHYGYSHQRVGDTLDQVLKAPDRNELMDWLRKQPLMHVDEDRKLALVHAGIPPQWSIKKARSLAKEVESVLRSKKIDKFLEKMYGNEPDHWDDGFSGAKRLRVITNYFTRMRFCDSEGKLEFTADSNPENGPKGYKPWFAHKLRKSKNYSIVFGHWAALEGKVSHPKLHALDTGCVWGGSLTLMDMDRKKQYRCRCHYPDHRFAR